MACCVKCEIGKKFMTVDLSEEQRRGRISVRAAESTTVRKDDDLFTKMRH